MLNEVLQFVREGHCQAHLISTSAVIQINNVLKSRLLYPNRRVVSKDARDHIIRPSRPTEGIFLDWPIKTAIRFTEVIFESSPIAVIEEAQQFKIRKLIPELGNYTLCPRFPPRPNFDVLRFDYHRWCHICGTSFRCFTSSIPSSRPTARTYPNTTSCMFGYFPHSKRSIRSTDSVCRVRAI